MKVYQVDECAWMMGEDGPSCVAEFIKEYGGEQECITDFGEPVEVTPEQMKTMLVRDEETGMTCTYEEEFNRMLAHGQNLQFPAFFACSEC
jgi:hypothetical protein